jgi:hypothetical protein
MSSFDDQEPDTNSGTPKAPSSGGMPVFVKFIIALVVITIVYNIF